MTSYYNEVDKHAAAWLRELVKAGHIADGIVDERDIQDVLPSDLDGFTQCHFFAGIGVWSYALRNSGWADDRPVWTGSCPCQPFSAAGKGSAFADERHLWPAFHHLIKEFRPPVVFGEQVASRDADAWIDLVQTDLEAVGYAVGAVPFPSASVGAPHIRDRLYWVADSSGARLDQRQRVAGIPGRKTGADERQAAVGNGVCSVVGLADMHGNGRCARREGCEAAGHGKASDADCGACGLADTDRPGQTNGFWRDADWLGCRDGKFRPVEPGTFPLVDGAAARVVRLRGYGNAINAVQAQAFIEAFMDYQQQVSA
ncbi:MAG: DNA cytosine methyltransferase [Candidatus Accumulibacter sp.]|uniref:DNA cytosine methyltransferase n=1 Tax=Accumulibacter sp. TaxID=2053492 RepID=UPI00259084D7|nr:DNA cytosine methyltransferase [Accumulibacter sp.]MBK8117586.1 DNA cytosine methyltransferase [Accumulibacter sp.]